MKLGKSFFYGMVAGLLGYEVWRCSRVRFRSLEIDTITAPSPPVGPVRILHLSDFHLTAATAPKLHQLDYLLERDWDLVMVSGDLIDEDSGIEPVCDFLGRLNATCGKFSVLGNHDFKCVRGGSLLGWIKTFISAVFLEDGRTSGKPNNVELLERRLAENGVHLLRNETASGTIPGGGEFQVFGIDDPATGRDRPELLYDDKRKQALRLVLTHAPKAIVKLAPLEPELVLCGHTHAGQIRVPGFGALVTRSDAHRRSCAGMVEIDGCRIHISPGFSAGRLFPFRVLARPEVTEIVLKSADSLNQPFSGKPIKNY